MTKEIHNLIILDKSGSMESIRNQAIAGVNETVKTIAKSQRETDVPNYVSIAAFCDCGIQYLSKHANPLNVPVLTRNEYEPCCCTPLYDAIGKCCTALKKRLGAKDDIAVSVTIITDGYENSSREWTAASVGALVDSLKADGWMFAYIGANQDAIAEARKMRIDNALDFCADEEGTKEMFAVQNEARESWAEDIMSCASPQARYSLSRDYFKRSKRANHANTKQK